MRTSAARALGWALALLIGLAGCASAATPSAAPTVPTDPPSAAPTETPATSTPAPEPTPSAVPTVAWEAVTVPVAGQLSAMTDVVPGGDGLLAIGYDGEFGSIVWTSSDGREWRDVTPAGFESAGLAGVIEFSGGLLAVGRANTLDVDAELAGAWLSTDGLNWRPATGSDEMRGQMIDAVETDAGLFAVGGVPGADSAGFWRSTDGGETWERIGGDVEHAFLWAIAEGGPGLVATGWRRNPEPDLAIWTSADGEDWTLAPDPEGFRGFEGVDIVNHDGTLIVAGRSVATAGARIWTSTDGLDWRAVELPDAPGELGLRVIVEAPYGVVAVGNLDTSAVAWVSIDAGTTWTALADPLPAAHFDGAFVTDAGELLAAGGTQEGTLETGFTGQAMIWHAVDDPAP
jgi:hypothetical protein